MDLQGLRELLARVARGEVSAEKAEELIAALAAQPVGDFANLDGERAIRAGAPEVIFGQGKTPEQIGLLVARLVSLGQAVLVTRMPPEAAPRAIESAAHGRHDPISRTFAAPASGAPREKRGLVSVVCAGTTDMPVAEEACAAVEHVGAHVQRIYDVGVSGLHRLLRRVDELRESDAVVVCAGMEGALPSVVAGLIPRPVIAVPTSVGYGANLGGVAALLAMLNCCAANVLVVNIDNGFSAGYSAALIARQGARANPEK